MCNTIPTQHWLLYHSPAKKSSRAFLRPFLGAARCYMQRRSVYNAKKKREW
nr:MAG TPA: hypothetical protein [Caudoviricetes sp.]